MAWYSGKMSLNVFNPIPIICVTWDKLLNKVPAASVSKGHTTKSLVPSKQKHLKKPAKQMPTRTSSTFVTVIIK